MTATAYADIRRRLAEATGPGNQAIARDAALLFREDEHAYPRIATLLMRAIVVGSLDAAIALVEEKLPGWSWSVDTMTVPPGDWSKLKRLPLAKLAEPVVTEFGLAVGQRAYQQAATPALALLSALFAALEYSHD